jgi:hypothetical protein
MLGDLGTPDSMTEYTLCLYAGSTSASVFVPAGSKWEPAGSTAFKFKDSSGTPAGARKAVRKSGTAGKSKVLLKGKGVNLPDVLTPQGLPLPVTVQLVNSDTNTCFKAVYNSAGPNDANQFKATRRASDPGCGNDMVESPIEECDGNADGACPGICTSDCRCCEATTGGFCWFLGDADLSCDAVCAAAGKVYDPATETFAGSGGTSANCGAVLQALGVGNGSAADLSCTLGVGCTRVAQLLPCAAHLRPQSRPSRGGGAATCLCLSMKPPEALR